VAKVQAAKVRESLKQQATVSRATPGQLIIDSTVNAAIDWYPCSHVRPRSCMLVFCADTALHLLAHSSTWIMDGAFNTALNMFSQLYVIRAPPPW